MLSFQEVVSEDEYGKIPLADSDYTHTKQHLSAGGERATHFKLMFSE